MSQYQTSSLHKIFGFCKKVAENENFQSTILLIILINALFLWLETSNEIMSSYSNLIVKVLVWSQIIFVWEIVIRILAYWPNSYKNFFGEFWNRFDFIIVLCSFLPEIGWIVTVVRILRILRILRVFSVSDRLRNYFDSLKTLPSSILMGSGIYLVLTYTIAIMGYYLFANIDPSHWWTLWLAFESVVFMTLLQDVRWIFDLVLKESLLYLLFIISFYLCELMFLIKLINPWQITSNK